MSKTLQYSATKVDGSTAVSSLERFQWKNRVVVIFADTDNAKASRQENLLLAERDGLAERDLVVLRIAQGSVAPLFGVAEGLEADMVRTDLEGPDAGIFAAVLVGKDGSVKLRAVEPITAGELFVTIDGMPMRAAETTRQHDL
ncbi:MAG: DUF4174 domain-containing protein [Rhizobium sp.]